MGLILCESVNVANPLHIEVLSLNIYSFEELCYIIYENPILLTEGIVNDNLIDFIDRELKLNTLAGNIKKRRANGAKDEDILIYIIESCDLYNNAEAINFRNSLSRLKKMSEEELLKLRGDYMFYIGKYGLAKKYYSAVLDIVSSENSFLGSVYHNIGVTYANLFLYKEAYDALKKSYELTYDESILMEIYCLKKIFISESDKYIEDEGFKALFKPELVGESENAFRAAVNGVRESSKLHEIEDIFQIEDKAGEKKLIEEYIDNWKQEYRNMK